MNKRVAAFTLVEGTVLLLLLIALGFILCLVLPRSIRESHQRACANNLKEVGQAILCYTTSNTEYFPFSWGPADSDTMRQKDAMTSIGELYPEYMMSAKAFRCPLRGGNPLFSINLPRTPDGREATRDSSAYLHSIRNSTLHNTTYGYDCRLSPTLACTHPLLADMPDDDGTFTTHQGGFNVIYADWTVRPSRRTTTSSEGVKKWPWGID